MGNLAPILNDPELADVIDDYALSEYLPTGSVFIFSEEADLSAKNVLSAYTDSSQFKSPKVFFFEVEPKDTGDILHSCYFAALKALYMRDIDYLDTDNHDLLQYRFALVYSHELAHHCGVRHFIRTGNSVVVYTGFLLEADSKYRAMDWLNEVLTSYLAAEIFMEMRFRVSTFSVDYSDRPESYQQCFDALCDNLLWYIKHNEDWEDYLGPVFKLLGINTAELNLDGMAKLFVAAHVNRDIQNVVRDLFMSAYSAEPIINDTRYKNKWEAFCDQIGLLSDIEVVPQDFWLSGRERDEDL